MEELDLVECLVAQVASLSSSLACEVAIVESPTPPPMDLQSNFVIPSATPPDCGCTGCRRRVIDRPLVVLDLHATGVGESYKANPHNFATLEVCLKGAASVSFRRSARRAVKCHGGTFECPVPHRCLPSKVVPRQHMACPRSCSLHPLHGGTSSGLCCIVAAPPG
jgi:hypothetical protein